MLQQVGFFSYLGYLCLRAIQWSWGLTLTAEPVQDSLEQTVVHLWVHFSPEMAVLMQVELVGNFCVMQVFVCIMFFG